MVTMNANLMVMVKGFVRCNPNKECVVSRGSRRNQYQDVTRVH
jgi:hypothetical protein